MAAGIGAGIGLIAQVLGLGQSIVSQGMSYRMQQQMIHQQQQTASAENLRCPDGSVPVSVTIHPDNSKTIVCK